MRTPEKVATAARAASETGADFIKTVYTGDKKSFKVVLDNCSVPVLISADQKLILTVQFWNWFMMTWMLEPQGLLLGATSRDMLISGV